MKIIEQIRNSKKNNKKIISILIDPDKTTEDKLTSTIKLCNSNKIDLIFFGGSLINSTTSEHYLRLIKKNSKIPIILFPGTNTKISNGADGFLLLSLISGRNPNFLIGKHVEEAFKLKKSSLEIIPTGYILVGNEKNTAVSYISNTTPIPSEQHDIGAATAIAGELLGFQLIYLEAGSGSNNCVNENMILNVSKNIDCPLIVGGGLNTIEKIELAFKNGADIVVIGNAVEKNQNILNQIGKIKK